MHPVFTIGHSTRPLAQFLALLGAQQVTLLVDVRTVPRSRHNPQFNRETLPAALAAAGIGYRHLAELGGLRHAHKDSPNGGWRNASFRGYADYMLTPAFAAAVDEIVTLAAAERCALMCAEAVPWRCHRSLVGDALVVRGIEVLDIVGEHGTTRHRLTPFARVEGTLVTYPPAPADAIPHPPAPPDPASPPR